MAMPVAPERPARRVPAEAEAAAARRSSRCSSSSSRCSPATSRAPAAARSSSPPSLLKQRMPVEQAVAAIEECGAPMVSIAGGEPLMHPQIDEIVAPAARPQQDRLPVHQRGAAAQAPAHASRRTATSPGWCTSTGCASGTTRRSARTACSTRPSPRSSRRRPPGSGSPPTPRSSTPTRRRTSSTCSTSSTTSSASTTCRSRPAYAYEKAPDQEHFLGVERDPRAVPQGVRRRPAQAGGGSTTRRCSSTSSRARSTSRARRGRSRPTRCWAGSGPAT